MCYTCENCRARSDCSSRSSLISVVKPYICLTDLSGECGGILTEPTGEIKSVDRNGDHLYENDLDCLWLIIAEKGYVIELKFRHFDLEYDDDCRFDFILVSLCQAIQHYLLWSFRQDRALSDDLRP